MNRSETNLQVGVPRTEVRFIKINEVLAICRMSRSAVYKAIKEGRFPAPVKLSVRSSAWVEEEVQQWMEACITTTRSR